MISRLTRTARATRIAIARLLRRPASGGAPLASTEATFGQLLHARRVLAITAGLGLAGCMLVTHPPVRSVGPGELGVRTNQLTGDVVQWRDGSVLVVPGVHQVQVFSLRDRVYRPGQLARAEGGAPLQSVEGLSVGVDLAVRYALDPARVATLARDLPADVDAEIVQPAVQGVAYKLFARYTVREIFSTRRAEIQQLLEQDLRSRLAADGVVLRSVLVGKVDLPADYRKGMEGLLATELETQKMRYTLELKDKRVKETELEASAEKVRREVRAEAAAREQVIAARAQEEAMKHVLPLKERQIQQRQLEAEAEKRARLKLAEGNAQARIIEAGGEADARRKLAEADVFRLEKVGLANAQQMEREGSLITRHPLLIQKTLADKLSDKVQVIIAPPGAGGAFLAANLLGGGAAVSGRDAAQQAPAPADKEE